MGPGGYAIGCTGRQALLRFTELRHSTCSGRGASTSGPAAEHQPAEHQPVQWTCGDLNPRPLQCDCSALPTELQARAQERSVAPSPPPVKSAPRSPTQHRSPTPFAGNVLHQSQPISTFAQRRAPTAPRSDLWEHVVHMSRPVIERTCEPRTGPQSSGAFSGRLNTSESVGHLPAVNRLEPVRLKLHASVGRWSGCIVGRVKHATP